MSIKYKSWIWCGAISTMSLFSTLLHAEHEVRTMLFDLEDGYWNQFTNDNCEALNLEFSANITYHKIHDQVFVQIPELNFVVPETVDQCYLDNATIPPPDGGYLYTKDGFIPHEFRPNVVVPFTFAAEEHLLLPLEDPPVNHTGQSYELQIDTEGRIKIAGLGFNPITPGPHTILPTSVTYYLNKNGCHAPKNIPVSKTPSIPNNSNSPNQFLELQMNSFEDGRVAFTFGDNSGPNQPILTKNIVAVADVVQHSGKPRLKFTVPQLVYDPSTIGYGDPAVGYFTGIETDVAINPTDKNNIVVIEPVRVQSVPPSAPFPNSRDAVVYQYSLDGGQTWSSPGRVDFDNLTRLRTDARLKADSFGNFWLIYGNKGPLYDQSTDSGVSMTVFVSSDKGATWQQVAEFLPPDADTFGFDYPMLSEGGDGSGGKAMYFTWVFYDEDIQGNAVFKTYMAAFTVGGLGGPFGVPTVINNFPQLDNFISFGNLIATNDGTVIFAAPDSLGSYGGFGVPWVGLENHNYLTVHQGGLNNFTPEGFSELRLIEYDTIGFNNDAAQHNVVWQRPRGILSSVQTQGLGYDEISGRLYALVLSEVKPQVVTDDSPASLHYNKGIMNLIWSTNLGKTWSEPIPIRDSDVGQAGVCSVNIDRTTGNLVFGWYDPREDPEDQQEIKWWATIIAPPKDQTEN